ncbi:hypothetical protein [Nostoc flagelliforme]|uniref:hypothetical protein n=1 Tax=Nostoc flagelliforme TaxID=1306274 RepID=UPI0012FD444F|nr:hypothetical protein [Nostoc flagelliforme]
MNAIFGVDPSVAVLTRRTRDRFALGVGGSYGQGDYWLSQLDPQARKSHSANADSEPRVLKSWKDALTTYANGESSSISFSKFSSSSSVGRGRGD